MIHFFLLLGTVIVGVVPAWAASWFFGLDFQTGVLIYIAIIVTFSASPNIPVKPKHEV